MKRPIRQMTHLGVAAFACVLAQSVRLSAYLLECQQHRGTQDAIARAAAGTVLTGWVQISHFAERADEVIVSGSQGEAFHFITFLEAHISWWDYFRARLYKPTASMSISANRPRNPNTMNMSSAPADVVGSSIWRNVWRIFFLLC